MAKKVNKNEKLKYAAIPAAIGAIAGAALFLKKAPKAGVEKTGNPVKDHIKAYREGFRARHQKVVEIIAQPEEYDPVEIKSFIKENLCVNEITEQDWMMGGVKLLFTAIETNYNDMLAKNSMEIDAPVWHGYVAATEGEGKYILKDIKENSEDIYMFWEEKSGFIFALHEGLDYLMQLQCGMTTEEFEEQGPKYMNYMGLLQVLIEKFEIDLNDDVELVDALEACVLEKYFVENK